MNLIEIILKNRISLETISTDLNEIKVYQNNHAQIVELLSHFKIRNLELKTGYGNIPEPLNRHVYQNSLHPSSVTFLKITSNSLNIPQSSYDSFIKALSKVVGSSFRHNFDYLSPFPLFEFRDSSGSFNGMLRLFPREQANADSYNSWQYLFPEFHVEKSELQTDHIIEEYETSLVVHALSDSKLSIDEASEQFVRQIPVSFHDSDRFLHREVIDSRNLAFSVKTELLPYEASSIVSVIEVIPIQYSYLLSRSQFFVINVTGNGEEQIHQLGNLVDLATFHWTNRHCEIQFNHFNFENSSSQPNIYQSQKPINGRHCEQTFSFDIELRSNQRLSYELHGVKSFISLEDFPPDASNGIRVLPAIIRFHNLDANISHAGGRTFVTKDHLLSQPIPDLSMPYNVVALSCTLIAFLIGSIVNAWARRYLKKPENNESNGKD